MWPPWIAPAFAHALDLGLERTSDPALGARRERRGPGREWCGRAHERPRGPRPVPMTGERAHRDVGDAERRDSLDVGTGRVDAEDLVAGLDVNAQLGAEQQGQAHVHGGEVGDPELPGRRSLGVCRHGSESSQGRGRTPTPVVQEAELLTHSSARLTSRPITTPRQTHRCIRGISTRAGNPA